MEEYEKNSLVLAGMSKIKYTQCTMAKLSIVRLLLLCQLFQLEQENQLVIYEYICASFIDKRGTHYKAPVRAY